MPVEARMIDANANRAAEALRVMEDAARFAIEDASIASRLKSMRHELRRVLDRLPAGWLAAHRDTASDVGTSISTRSEMSRAGLRGVVIAAGKRLTEALRVIEECAKMFDGSIASDIESLRYAAYDIDASLQLRFGAATAPQWRVCVLLTRSICRLPWREVVRQAVDAGADCIQVREKDVSDGDLVRHVREVIDLARPAGASVIVNDRVDVALAAGADGVHLGRDDLSILDARKLAGTSLLIGASTHDLDEARQAIEAGADVCGVGAMFGTSLKPDRTPSGPAYLREFVQHFPKTPHLAIGGIMPENIGELVEAGVRGVAVSSCVCAANEPGAIVARLVDAVAVNASRV